VNDQNTFGLIFSVLMASSLLVSCGGDGGGDGGGATDNFDATDRGTYTVSRISLSGLLDAPAARKSAPTSDARQLSQRSSDCLIIMDVYNTTGSCITPLAVTGYAEQAAAGRSNGPNGARILGPDEFATPAGGIFDGQAFDLSAPVPLVTNNTLFEQYNERTQYDVLAMNLAWYQVQFPLTISSGTRYVTMLLAKYGQPFATSAAMDNAMANCGLAPEDATQARYIAADLLPGMTFQRGDYLFCVKDSPTESCAPADFRWLDSANNTLVANRPAQPKTSHWLTHQEVACVDEGGGRVNFNFGTFGLFANIADTSEFKLWSDFSHGSFSQQWPTGGAPAGNEAILEDPTIAWISPYFIYYHQHCGSGACDSQISSGPELDIDVTFDTDGMVMVEGLGIDAIAALDNVGEALSRTHLKSQWALDQKSINNVIGLSTNHVADLTVAVDITVGGQPTNPPDEAITLCADLDASAKSGTDCP
jgi:hypothetical protein